MMAFDPEHISLPLGHSNVHNERYFETAQKVCKDKAELFKKRIKLQWDFPEDSFSMGCHYSTVTNVNVLTFFKDHHGVKWLQK